MKLIAALCIWLSFSTPTISYHEFYLSVTDINYVQDEKSLQIISRVFTDDLENVINTRYEKDFKLIPRFEVEEIDTYIKKYIQTKFILETNQGRLPLKYLGRKYEDDMVYLFLEVVNIDDFEYLSVENSMLTDLFEDQKNMIHFKSNDFKKSFILEKELSKRKINYNTK